MDVFTMKKRVGMIAAAMAAMAMGVGFAADGATAPDISDQIDKRLQKEASDFTREIRESTDQYREAQRLGVSPQVRNAYGVSDEIDSEFTNTASRANKDLEQAMERDEYTFQKRQLENTRSLYYPGSDDYNRFTNQIQELENKFADQERNR